MEKAKKFKAIILSFILIVCIFTGCSNNTKVDINNADKLLLSDWLGFEYISTAKSRIGKVYRISAKILKTEEKYFISKAVMIDDSLYSFPVQVKMKVYLSSNELKDLQGEDIVSFVGEITDVQGKDILFRGAPSTEVNVIFGNAILIEE